MSTEHLHQGNVERASVTTGPGWWRADTRTEFLFARRGTGDDIEITVGVPPKVIADEQDYTIQLDGEARVSLADFLRWQ
jgi:hypothetical protein